MYENFFRLNKEKQLKIQNAAMIEFSRYGYKKTSISQIAESAEISKSMLFYYFGTKEQLYDFLVIKACDYMLDKIEKLLCRMKDLDYIESYSLASKYKLKLFKEEDALMRFSGTILYLEEEENLSKEAKTKLDNFKKIRDKYVDLMYMDKENTKLRKDIAKEISLKYIKWIMDGFSQEIIQKIQMNSMADVNFEEDWEAFDYLLENLEIIFYKEGD